MAVDPKLYLERLKALGLDGAGERSGTTAEPLAGLPGAQAVLHGLGRVLSPAKQGVDWLTRQGIRAQGMEAFPEDTAESVFRESVLGLPGRGDEPLKHGNPFVPFVPELPNPDTYAGRLLGAGTEFAVGTALDPLTYATAGLGTAARGSQTARRTLVRLAGEDIAPEATAALTRAVRPGVERLAKGTGAAFTGLMAGQGVEAGLQTADTLGREGFSPTGIPSIDLPRLREAFTPEVAEQAFHTVLAGGGALGGAAHLASLRDRPIRERPVVLEFPPTRPEPPLPVPPAEPAMPPPARAPRRPPPRTPVQERAAADLERLLAGDPEDVARLMAERGIDTGGPPETAPAPQARPPGGASRPRDAAEVARIQPGLERFTPQYLFARAQFYAKNGMRESERLVREELQRRPGQHAAGTAEAQLTPRGRPPVEPAETYRGPLYSLEAPPEGESAPSQATLASQAWEAKAAWEARAEEARVAWEKSDAADKAAGSVKADKAAWDRAEAADRATSEAWQKSVMADRAAVEAWSKANPHHGPPEPPNEAMSDPLEAWEARVEKAMARARDDNQVTRLASKAWQARSLARETLEEMAAEAQAAEARARNPGDMDAQVAQSVARAKETQAFKDLAALDLRAREATEREVEAVEAREVGITRPARGPGGRIGAETLESPDYQEVQRLLPRVGSMTPQDLTAEAYRARREGRPQAAQVLIEELKRRPGAITEGMFEGADSRDPVAAPTPKAETLPEPSSSLRVSPRSPSQKPEPIEIVLPSVVPPVENVSLRNVVREIPDSGLEIKTVDGHRLANVHPNFISDLRKKEKPGKPISRSRFDKLVSNGIRDYSIVTNDRGVAASGIRPTDLPKVIADDLFRHLVSESESIETLQSQLKARQEGLVAYSEEEVLEKYRKLLNKYEDRVTAHRNRDPVSRSLVRERLRLLFKNQKIEETPEGYFSVRTVSGRTVEVDLTEFIDTDADMSAHGAYGALPSTIKAGPEGIARVRIDGNALIEIKSVGSLPHEFIHVYYRLFTTAAERAQIEKIWRRLAEEEGLGRKFEEVFADAFRVWFEERYYERPTGSYGFSNSGRLATLRATPIWPLLERVFERIDNLASRMLSAVGINVRPDSRRALRTGDAAQIEAIFRKIDSGEPFARTRDELEGVTGSGSPGPAYSLEVPPTVGPSSQGQAPPSGESLRAAMQGVVARRGVKPAASRQPLTVEERRVRDLARVLRRKGWDEDQIGDLFDERGLGAVPSRRPIRSGRRLRSGDVEAEMGWSPGEIQRLSLDRGVAPPAVFGRAVQAVRRDRTAPALAKASDVLEAKAAKGQAADPKVQSILESVSDAEFYKRMESGVLEGDEARAWRVRVRQKAEGLEVIESKLTEARISGGATLGTAARLLDAQMEFIRAERASLNDQRGAAAAAAIRRKIRERAAEAEQSKAPMSDTTFLRKVLLSDLNVTDRQAHAMLGAWKSDPAALPALLRAASKKDWVDKGLELWKAGLLSGIPATDIANVGSNLIEHAFQIGETAAGVGMDWLESKLSGKARERFAGEVMAELSGSARAFFPALRKFGKNMLDVVSLKEAPIDPNKPLEYQTGAVGGVTGRVARALFRRLEAEDMFVKEFGGAGEARKLALRKARAELGPGANSKAAWKRMLEIESEILDPTNNSHRDLIEAVGRSRRDRTFQTDPGRLVQWLQQGRNQFRVLHVPMPFLQTPVNIFGRFVQRSPAGFLKAANEYRRYRRGEITRDQAIDALARPLIGTVITFGFASLAQAGGMTGSGPTDPKERAAKMETGWQPNSFVLPGADGLNTYIPFGRFQPIAGLLGMIADMVEANDSEKSGEMFDVILGSLVDNVLKQPYLVGFTDAAKVIDEPERYGAQYISNLAGSAIPAGVARLARAVDPVVRDVKPSDLGLAGVGERLANTMWSRIPGLSQGLPAKRGATGEEIARPGGPGVAGAVGRFALPSMVSRDRPGTEVQDLFVNIGYVPSAPPRDLTYKGRKIPLGEREYAVLQAAQRQATKRIRGMMRSPAWTRLPDTELEGGANSKEALVRRAYGAAQAAARNRVMGSSTVRRAIREVMRQ